MTRVAALQMVSTPAVEENIAAARRLIAEAAGQGAQLVLLPEYWSSLGRSDSEKLVEAEKPGSGMIQDFMASAAREHGIWLIGGTLSLTAQQVRAEAVFRLVGGLRIDRHQWGIKIVPAYNIMIRRLFEYVVLAIYDFLPTVGKDLHFPTNRSV